MTAHARPAGGATAAPAVTLSAGAATLTADPGDGGRWTSWTVDGLELLSGADTGVGPAFTHGCFPMAPFAGRVRDGRVVIGGREHRLPARSGAHAIHGTVAGRPWTVRDAGPGHLELETALGPEWPAAGTARQRLRLREDRLDSELAVTAEAPMPVTLGWHPWFARRLARGGPAEWELSGGRQWVKGDDGLPTGELTDPRPGPWDDAFRDVTAGLRWPGALALALHTDARDVVLFDGLDDVLCLEPQTGPPDAARLGLATTLAAGETATLTCSWRWRGRA